MKDDEVRYHISGVIYKYCRCIKWKCIWYIT